MIVTDCDATVLLSEGGRPHASWRCLARRGMLHSETEAFEYWNLLSGKSHESLGWRGHDRAVYVISGKLRARWNGETSADLATSDVALIPYTDNVELIAGPTGAEILILVVMPTTVSSMLDRRVPEL